MQWMHYHLFILSFSFYTFLILLNDREILSPLEPKLEMNASVRLHGNNDRAVCCSTLPPIIASPLVTQDFHPCPTPRHLHVLLHSLWTILISLSESQSTSCHSWGDNRKRTCHKKGTWLLGSFTVFAELTTACTTRGVFIKGGLLWLMD